MCGDGRDSRAADRRMLLAVAIDKIFCLLPAEWMMSSVRR